MIRVTPSVRRTHILRCVAALTLWSALGGCGETMRLESDMSMDADLSGTMRMEGPIEIRMQGPSVTYEGVHVAESIFDRVMIDSTRSDWVLAVFGEPTRRATLDDGTEIWTWSYMPVRQEGSPLVTLFEIGGGDDGKPTIQSSTTFVQLRDGVVIDKWRH